MFLWDGLGYKLFLMLAILTPLLFKPMVLYAITLLLPELRQLLFMLH